MSRSAERRAANESLFRDANERIEDTATELGLSAGRLPFICECEDERCTTTIQVTLPVYEQVRGEARRFLVAPNHQSIEDRVVEERDRFTVVEKTGEEGKLVEASYPRS